MTKSARKWIRRIAGFCTSNLLGTIVDTLVLWFFSNKVFSSSAGQFIISPFISFECAVMVNFLCSYNFIWKERIPHRSSTRSFLHHYWMYNLSCTGVFLFKMVLLLALAAVTDFSPVICNLLALLCTGCINFILGDRVIFKNKQSAAK